MQMQIQTDFRHELVISIDERADSLGYSLMGVGAMALALGFPPRWCSRSQSGDTTTYYFEK